MYEVKRVESSKNNRTLESDINKKDFDSRHIINNDKYT